MLRTTTHDLANYEIFCIPPYFHLERAGMDAAPFSRSCPLYLDTFIFTQKLSYIPIRFRCQSYDELVRHSASPSILAQLFVSLKL